MTGFRGINRRRERPGRALGDFLKAIYHRKGWSRFGAAARLDVTPQYLANILEGYVMLPRAELVRRFRDVWGINPVDFLLHTKYLTEADIDEWLYNRHRSQRSA